MLLNTKNSELKVAIVSILVAIIGFLVAYFAGQDVPDRSQKSSPQIVVSLKGVPPEKVKIAHNEFGEYIITIDTR